MRRVALTLVGLLLVMSVASCDSDGTAMTPASTSPPSTSASATTVAATTTTTTAALTTMSTIPAESMPPMQLPWFPGQWELAGAWALWESQGLDAYRFDISGSSAWMGFGSYEVFVSGDEVSVVTVDADGGNPELAAVGAEIKACFGRVGVPAYPNIGRASRALGHLWRYHEWVRN